MKIRTRLVCQYILCQCSFSASSILICSRSKRPNCAVETTPCGLRWNASESRMRYALKYGLTARSHFFLCRSSGCSSHCAAVVTVLTEPRLCPSICTALNTCRQSDKITVCAIEPPLCFRYGQHKIDDYRFQIKNIRK